MNVESFRKGIKELTALPDSEVERALLIASALNDDERAEFFGKIKEMNDGIAHTYKEEEKAVEGMEGAVVSAEKAVKAAERGGAEAAEQEQTMEQVEQKFADS